MCSEHAVKWLEQRIEDGVSPLPLLVEAERLRSKGD